MGRYFERKTGWSEDAHVIGNLIQETAKRHRELLPLLSCWKNFAHKHRPSLKPSSEADLIIVRREDFAQLIESNRRMSEEIEALDFRVKSLLEG